MSFPAILVRPGAELGARLTHALPDAGVSVGENAVLPAEWPEPRVAEALRERACRLLVIPFRQPTTNGARTNGVELLQRLESEVPAVRRIPVLLVVSIYSAGAARLILGEANPDETLTRETRHRILVVQEDELEEPRSHSMIRMHLRLHGGP